MKLSYAALLVLACAACSGHNVVSHPAPDDASQFFASLGALCGKAFAGRVAADAPATRDDPFSGKALVMHVRECSSDEIRIPFHVGDDRSRTWVVTRTASGLRLKHDHRHADGSPDTVTMYGGDSEAPGTANAQIFPVDAESIALFRREGLTASVQNRWSLEFDRARNTFSYGLQRPGREFRVEFDLARQLPEPLAPWGSDR